MAIIGSEDATSSSASPFTHHVFLSRGGEDTRWTFSDHLYAALIGSGFRTFRDEQDNETYESSVKFKLDLEREIKESRSCLVVFSRGFVDSSRCLDELVMILERKKTCKNLVVLPVFFDLDPSEVRKQTGIVAEAFARHKARFLAESYERERETESHQMEVWREALRVVADMAGLVLQNQADGHESKFIKIIVEEIANKLDRTVLSVTPYPTGIDSYVKDINRWLQDGSNNIGIMMIYGMGGIGKTTIAKIAYNQNFERFEGSSFVANIRETSNEPNGLVRIQKQLISNILKQRKEKIRNVDEGNVKIKNAMCCRKVLVVLDDVDELDQLNAILGMRNWFHPGSKIIVTTRQERILKGHEVCEVCEVKKLNDLEALSLFCRHAFGQDHPIEPYTDRSRRAVTYCNGLPLALEVLSSSLSGESIDIWDSALAKLQTFPNVKIQNVLQTSYDCLDEHDKNLFLDIVCFFVGMDKDFMVKILDGCDFYPTYGIQNLLRKCLVDEYQNTLWMHQLIRDMGREIILQESPKEPGRRSRLWHHKDAFDVLKEKAGTQAVEGLILDLDAQKEDLLAKKVKNAQKHHTEDLVNKSNMLYKSSSSSRRHPGLFSWLPISSAFVEPISRTEADLETDAFSRMRNLRILQLYDVQLSGGYDEFPRKLRWLCWRRFPLTCIPSDFPLEKMVVLDLPYSRLEQFWHGTKLLKLLKILNLNRSYSLNSSPDFSKLPNLEKVILKDCINLVEVHESIAELERLVLLNLKGCRNLRKLPGKICQLNSLEELIISGCTMLTELPVGLCKMESLKEFQADGLDLASSTTGEVKSWRAVLQFWASKLNKSPEFSLGSLPSHLVSLSLADCNISDHNFPMDLSTMPLLQGLRLSRNPIRNLPASIKNLSELSVLDLERCTRLQTLPELPSSLKGLSLYGCRSLETAMNLPNLSESLMLSITGCFKLVQIEELFKLEPVGNFDSEMIYSLGLIPMDTMGGLEVELFSSLTYTKTKFPVPQGLFECGIYSIFLPGDEVPCWFSIKNLGSTISFRVPLLPNVRIRGLNVCVSYELSLDWMKANWMYECITVWNKTKGLKWTYRPTFLGVANEEKGMIWLSDWKIGIQQMEGGDEVTVSAKMEENYRAKELGVRILYTDQEEEGTQETSSCPSIWSGIDLLAYQMRSGEYFLCNQDKFNRSEYYKRIAGSPSDLVETCFCGFQCDAHAK